MEPLKATLYTVSKTALRIERSRNEKSNSWIFFPWTNINSVRDKSISCKKFNISIDSARSESCSQNYFHLSNQQKILLMHLSVKCAFVLDRNHFRFKLGYFTYIIEISLNAIHDKTFYSITLVLFSWILRSKTNYQNHFVKIHFMHVQYKNK